MDNVESFFDEYVQKGQIWWVFVYFCLDRGENAHASGPHCFPRGPLRRRFPLMSQEHLDSVFGCTAPLGVLGSVLVCPHPGECLGRLTVLKVGYIL